VLHEVVEQRRPERTLAIRRADHGHRLGPQKAIDLLVGETPLGHCALLPEACRPDSSKALPLKGEGWVGVHGVRDVDARLRRAPPPLDPLPAGEGEMAQSPCTLLLSNAPRPGLKVLSSRNCLVASLRISQPPKSLSASCARIR